MMKKIAVLIFLTCLGPLIFAQSSRFEDDEPTNTNVTAQEEAAPSRQTKIRSPFWERTRFGGNLGLQLGTFTFINLSPRMYYVVTDQLWVGTGVTFIYSRDNTNYTYPVPKEYREQVVYGFNFFSTYQLIGPIFAQAEYEPLSFERFSRNTFGDIVGKERLWTHNVLLGGGITQKVGRGAVFFSVLYNVTYTNSFDSYYSSPWVFRMGVGM